MTNTPEIKFRAGPVTATVWKNQTEKEGKLPKTCDHYRKVKNTNLLNFDDIYTRLK